MTKMEATEISKRFIVEVFTDKESTDGRFEWCNEGVFGTIEEAIAETGKFFGNPVIIEEETVVEFKKVIFRG